MELDGCSVVKSKFFGYRLVYPIKNKDGSTNWFNLLTGGSWWNIIKVVGVVILMVVLVVSYKHDTAALIECCQRFYDASSPSVLQGGFNPLNWTAP